MTTLHKGFNDYGELTGPEDNFKCKEQDRFLIGNIDFETSMDRLGFEINPESENKIRPDSCSIQLVGMRFTSFPWATQAGYSKYDLQ